jgi:signal recognition particle receptor subunit beta
MPVVNPLARELVFKIVYYGPGLGGKTTNLQFIHNATRAEHRGKLVSLATPVDRTLYFDFLPIRLPRVRGMTVRLQLFTVPGQVHYNATRKLVLTGADGVVFVVDSQRERLDANVESMENLRENLREHGRTLIDVSQIIQYNKRDLEHDILPVPELEQRLNPRRAPAFSSVATRGEGVFETLEAIVQAVLNDFERRAPLETEARTPPLELPEGGLTDALRRVSEPASSRHGSEAWRARQAPNGEAPSGEAPVRSGPRPGSGIAIGRVALTVASSAPVLGDARDEELVQRDTEVDDSFEASLEFDDEAVLERGGVEPEVSAPMFALLWPVSEIELVHGLERALATRDFPKAVDFADKLAAHTLASGASLMSGAHDAPRDPLLAVLLLGLQGREYMDFRALVRKARVSGGVSEEEALRAYIFALQARCALSRFGA